MNNQAIVLMSNKLRRMTEAEMLSVINLVGGMAVFTEASEIGEVYRENSSTGFWYVALAYNLPGAVVIIEKNNKKMFTHLLTQEEADQIVDLLDPETFMAATETGKLFSSTYPGLGSVQWYPGNDDIPPAK